MNHAVTEFEDFDATETNIYLSIGLWHLKLKDLNSIEYENFRVDDLSVRKKECLFASQVSLSRCYDVYIELLCRNHFKTEFDLFEAFGSRVSEFLRVRGHFSNIDGDKLSDIGWVGIWFATGTGVDGRNLIRLVLY